MGWTRLELKVGYPISHCEPPYMTPTPHHRHLYMLTTITSHTRTKILYFRRVVWHRRTVRKLSVWKQNSTKEAVYRSLGFHPVSSFLVCFISDQRTNMAPVVG